LINPPWFWHGIINQGEASNELVIGVPTRYGGMTSSVAAFKSNPFLTLFALGVINIKYGGIAKFKNATDLLEDKIMANRAARMKPTAATAADEL
jgi:hypothetical protein